ncbi:MAG: tRNA dihydrouridine synthase DusB [Actinobacteria bacterium]|nr:tRNA dihydrouridine synthase DusB [Actinomycetota bacterium]
MGECSVSVATTIQGLRVGDTVIDPPVVLAPMAGITNRAFRRLCREQGAGLYVSEMVTSRALVERNATTMDMVTFAEDENPRSVQLYGVDPDVMARATRIIVEEDRADHVDLNFGCPVPKVTRKGGGSALPWKRDLFARIVQAVVAAADDRVPVSVKMRMGIDDDHLTYLEAGRAAAQAGVAWVSLHGRTAAQMYSGRADWNAIARLKEELPDTPVLGNGDIWTALDALAMVARTGCDGVVVGRGCLGRPWLFGQLVAAFRGEPIPDDPDLRTVIATLRRHAELLCSDYGEGKGCRDMRKHMAWYLKGFSARQAVRQSLGTVSTLEELDVLLAQIDPDQRFNAEVGAGPRGRTSGGRPPSLPEGWLDSPDLAVDQWGVLAEAELSVSGG